jgi:hypothetical protein
MRERTRAVGNFAQDAEFTTLLAPERWFILWQIADTNGSDEIKWCRIVKASDAKGE